MKKSKKLVFFGNERLATAVNTTAPTLRALVHAGYDIQAVVASHTTGVSRGQRRLEIVEVAHAYHVPVLLPDNLQEISSQLADYGAAAAVLVAYGQIIPESIIDIFPEGIVNIHPSLLPLYRGPTPVETAILEGVNETGVSLMRLVPKMDAGPIYAQQSLPLRGDETKQQLADKLLEMGGQLLLEHLPAILDGSAAVQEQDDTQAIYTNLIKKQDGVVDWQKPAVQIEREVRAYAGWPKTSAEIAGHSIIITQARIADSENGGRLVIKCRPGYLEIEELIAPSGRTMTSDDFLRGYSKPS